jgi:hypothetical protein
MNSEQEFQMFLAKGLHKLLVGSQVQESRSSKPKEITVIFDSLLVGETCRISSDYQSEKMTLPFLEVKKISNGSSDIDTLLAFYNCHPMQMVVQPNAEIRMNGELLRVHISPVSLVWKNTSLKEDVV